MMDGGSITRLIPDVCGRDEAAIEQLWRRYVARMEALARPLVAPLASGAGDEQDVAQSAFFAFCEAAAKGNVSPLADRNELWRLLATIARNKATDRVRRELRQRRGGGKATVEQRVEQMEDGRRSHVETLEIQEAFDAMLRSIDDSGDPRLRSVALMRLAGDTTPEIAERLNCTTRTVQRKLHILERLWQDQAS